MRSILLAAFAWALLVCAVLAIPVGTPTPGEVAIQEKRAPPRVKVQPRPPRARARGGRRRKDPPEKYFHESSFHHHYDGRFATKEVTYAERKVALDGLVKSYLTSMNEIGIQTWIMHGSLLGWWWNKRIMPWDSDLDVMVSEQAMEHLASYYNMTVHHRKFDGDEEGRNYILEINPHFRNTSIEDKYNRIDGRWIDTKSGLFIDITTLHHNVTAENEGQVGAMMSKDLHHYDIQDIFPLRESVFEGVPCLIPYGYTELLIEEYGPMSLIKRDFASHHFDQLTMEWIPIVEKTEEEISEEKKRLAADMKTAEETQANEDAQTFRALKMGFEPPEQEKTIVDKAAKEAAQAEAAMTPEKNQVVEVKNS